MKKNVFLLSLASIAGMTLFSSCLKHNDTKSTPSSAISVLHAAPGEPALDFYINSDKITSTPLPYTKGGSLQEASGTYNFNFVNPANSDTVVHAQDSLKPGKFYSFIVYDTTTPLKLMTIQDDFATSQDASSSYIRFLQLVPGNDVVNVYIDSVKSFSSRTFADNLADASRSKFSLVSQGSHDYTAVSAAGDTLGQLTNIALRPGGAYTVYLSGIHGHTDTTGVKLRVMANF